MKKIVYCIFWLVVAGLLLGKVSAQASEVADEIPEEFRGFFTDSDYEVTQITDDNGNSIWYLVNNIDGTRTKISEFNNIVSEAEAREGKIADLEKQVKAWRVAFICCLVALVVSLTLGAIILNNSRKKRSKHKRKKKKVNVRVDDYIDNGAIEYVEKNTK